MLSSSSFISYVSLKVISHERAIRAEITAQVDSTTDLLRLTRSLKRVGEALSLEVEHVHCALMPDHIFLIFNVEKRERERKKIVNTIHSHRLFIRIPQPASCSSALTFTGGFCSRFPNPRLPGVGARPAARSSGEGCFH